MVEGTKVLGEALAAGVAVESVFVASDLVGPDDPLPGLIDRAYQSGSRIYELEPSVLGRVAGTVTPQPVLAIVPQVDVELETLARRAPDFVVVLVDVRDPGNAGTVLRSAEAAGAGAVVCCDGSVDVYNPKTVRASAGALFHVPFVRGGDAGTVLDELGQWGLRRLGTAVPAPDRPERPDRPGTAGGQDYTTVDLTKPVALILGNEAHGLPDDIGARLDGLVTIPMAGQTESLNVGMAAAVLCFEVARQRRAGPVPTNAGPASDR